jgi:hypothetical protein
VKDILGKPVSGATVSAGFDGTMAFMGNLNVLYQRKTDVNGSYRFDGIYPGVPVQIQVKQAGFVGVMTPAVTAIGGKVKRMPDLTLVTNAALHGWTIKK